MRRRWRVILTVMLSFFVAVTMMPATPAMAEDGSGETTVSDFFASLEGTATVTEPTDYPYTVTEIDGVKWLKSTITSYGKTSSLKFTFSSAATMTFEYQMDCSSNSGLQVTNGSKTLYTYKSYGGTVSKINQKAAGQAEIQANSGDVVTVSFYRGTAGNNNSMYLRNFQISKPSQVIFHANNGTEATSTQGVFGTGKLNANTFSYDGHIFQGWAKSPDGEAVYADKSEITLDGDTDLYAVWENVYQVSFNVIPNDADFDLYSDAALGQRINPDKSGERVYTLQKGTYYWAASKFGCKDASGDVTVNDADISKNVSLESNPVVSTVFEYDGDASSIENPSLTVKCGEKAMSAREGNSYDLPTGYKYTYVFRSKNYGKVSGEIDLSTETAAGTRTIKIPLAEKSAWEGADDILEPAKKDDVYQISSGAELAWLAQQVNAGKEASASAKLTADIDLGNEDWTPIGSNAYGKKFTGKFDGDGHTVKGLHIESSKTDQGLFGYVNGATIENVIIKGSVTSTANNAGALVGTLNADYGTSAKVSRCINFATVKGANNVGGLIGYLNGSSSAERVIDNCVNYGQVSGNNSEGGIVGYMYTSADLNTCYNRGNITSAVSKAGGITGYMADAKASVKNCYTTGTVEGLNSAAVIGKLERGSADNNYYLDSLTSDENAKAINEADLKNVKFETPIDGFVKDVPDAINDGYPILSWQKEDNDCQALNAEIEEAKAYRTELNEDKYADILNALNEKIESAEAAAADNILNQADIDLATEGLREELQNAKDQVEAIKTKELQESVQAPGQADAASIRIKGDIKAGTMNLQWKEVEGATEYQIAFRKAGDAEWNCQLSDKTTATLSGLVKYGKYQIRIQAATSQYGVTKSGDWSKERNVFFAGTKAKLTKGKKKFTVKVSKVKSATGYQVIYSRSSAMSGAKVKTFSGTKKTVSKLRGKKTYYTIVRPIKKYQGRTYTGLNSSVKSVKTK